jgi:hypothetical protein
MFSVCSPRSLLRQVEVTANLRRCTPGRSDYVHIGEIEDLASWTTWRPLVEVVKDTTLPDQPGVYRVRHRESRLEFYVGCTHIRPVVDRLREYMAGRDLNGLGEAVLDLAVNDAEWLQYRLVEVRAGRSARTVHWARAALERADVEVSLAFTQPEEDRRELEAKTIDLLPQEHLRNKAVLRKLMNGQMR